MPMILPHSLLLKNRRTQPPRLALIRKHPTLMVLIRPSLFRTRNHRPHPHHAILPARREIPSISAKLNRPDGVLRRRRPRLRRGIRPSGRRALAIASAAQLLRQKHAVKLLLFLELGADFDVCRGRRHHLGVETDIVGIQLRIHTFESCIASL